MLLFPWRLHPLPLPSQHSLHQNPYRVLGVRLASQADGLVVTSSCLLTDDPPSPPSVVPSLLRTPLSYHILRKSPPGLWQRLRKQALILALDGVSPRKMHPRHFVLLLWSLKLFYLFCSSRCLFDKLSQGACLGSELGGGGVAGTLRHL